MRRLAALIGLSCIPLLAQLTPSQRLHDFQELAAAFNKFYAPANWKIQAFGVNLFDLRPYLDRVRTAKNDTEYLQICKEYVAALRDGHSTFLLPSDFQASLGISVDIYDGRVLIESINRTRYPETSYPFIAGDELVSIDGVAVEQIIQQLIKIEPLGNERASRRWVAQLITFRPQEAVPDAYLLPDQSTVQIRRDATGALESYALTWLKEGTPFVNLPALPDLILSPQNRSLATSVHADRIEDLIARDKRVLRSIGGRPDEELMDSMGRTGSKPALMGYGALTPYYALPEGFQRRRGSPGDSIFSGTYVSGDVRIGLIRIPTFLISPNAGRATFVRTFQNEVAYMQQNTDGLVIDVSRNNGGYCSADIAARLIPNTFRVYQDLILPSLADIQAYEEIIADALSFGADQWVIDSYQYKLGAMKQAAQGVRGMTGPVASCFTYEFSSFPAEVDQYLPVRNAQGEFIGYTKPMIVVQDELSASQAEHFTAMIQDAKRAPIVGVRSPGLGGGTSEIGVGYYSEASTGMTFSQSVRSTVVQAPGLPAAPYIENIGVLPDIPLDAMTRDNLMNQYRPFVEGFTRIIVDQVRRAQGQ